MQCPINPATFWPPNNPRIKYPRVAGTFYVKSSYKHRPNSFILAEGNLRPNKNRCVPRDKRRFTGKMTSAVKISIRQSIGGRSRQNVWAKLVTESASSNEGEKCLNWIKNTKILIPESISDTEDPIHHARIHESAILHFTDVSRLPLTQNSPERDHSVVEQPNNRARKLNLSNNSGL